MTLASDDVPDPRSLTIVVLALAVVGGLALTGGVVGDSSDDLGSGERVWQGQSIDLTAADSVDRTLTLVAVNGSTVRDVRSVDIGADGATIDTSTLAGSYAL
ncbi:MAG: hypothetical protein ABEJ86_07885, partial [Halococcoides sp.]